ncbi:MAG TPA: hypothetical protein VG222_02085 [Vicinamibacterales bacterium]|nr:hypothetical protein [Vicinamibacterales bacterium]
MAKKKPARRKSARPATRQPKAPNFHDQSETGHPLNLRAALDALKLDLALSPLDDTTIYVYADRLAGAVYGSYNDLLHAFNVTMGEVQGEMGDAIFNRLEGTSAATARRLVLAGYFLGVHCGRMTQPTSGGAR